MEKRKVIIHTSQSWFIQKSLDTGLTQCHQNLASLLIHLCEFHSLATQAAPPCGFYSHTKQ